MAPLNFYISSNFCLVDHAQFLKLTTILKKFPKYKLRKTVPDCIYSIKITVEISQFVGQCSSKVILTRKMTNWIVESAYDKSRARAVHRNIACGATFRARNGVRVNDELNALQLVVASPEAYQVHQTLRVEARAATQVAVHTQSAAIFRAH